MSRGPTDRGKKKPYRLDDRSLVVFRRRIQAKGFAIWLACVAGTLIFIAAAYDKSPEVSGPRWLAVAVLCVLLLLPVIPSRFLARFLSVPWAGYNLSFYADARTVISYDTVLAGFDEVTEVVATERERRYFDHNGALRSALTELSLVLSLTSGKELIVYDWGTGPDAVATMSTAEAIAKFVGAGHRWDFRTEDRAWSDAD